MYIIQLAVKTQLIYCTLCTMYKNYMFRPFWPSSGRNSAKKNNIIASHFMCMTKLPKY